MCPGAAKPSPRAARPGGCGRVPVPTCEPARTERDLIPRPCRAGCMGPTPQGPPRGEETRPRPRPHPALVTRPPLLPGGAGSRLTRPHTDGPTGEPRVDIVGSGDRAPGGARAGEWGNWPCLVCVLECRPRGQGGGRPGGEPGGCPGGQARMIVVAALRPLAKQEVPGALPAGCWPGLPELLGTPSPQARGAGMHPRPGPGLSGPPAPHRRPDTPSPARDGPLPGGSCLGPCQQPDQGEA